MKYWKFLFKLCLFCCFFGIFGIFSLYAYAYFSSSLDIENTTQVILYDDKENIMYQSSNSNSWVSLDDISPYVIDAVISVEDKNFYSHHGFDYFRIMKALLVNLENRSITQGASTISQQYIKNLYLDFNKTWERKAEEALLTMKLETHYDKDEILEGYLNNIYYGNGNYGIESASEFYFNKNSLQLTLEESLMLVGIPKSPNSYNPLYDYNSCVERAKVVALTMVDNNYLTDNEYNQLFLNKINIHGKKSKNELSTSMYYYDAVLEELNNISSIPSSLMNTGGLKIFTSYNKEAQTYMENAIKTNMNDNDDLQVASVIINPNSGCVMALAGGYDYSISQYNRVTQAKRQVGSAIKPLLYYSALENGMVSSSTFLSEPTTFVFANNDTYSPSNYNDKYGNKNITMAAALSYSDNIYAVKTHLFLGENELVNTAKRMGIETPLIPNPSLALGTTEINMLDFANAYLTLANEGISQNINFILKVEDMNGNILYERENEELQVLNHNYVYILNELMTTTYNSAFNNYNSPTVISLASKISRKYSIKTGSSGSDFWMIGYNPDILMLVWNGNDDNSNLEVKQGAISKKIWVDTVENILKDTEISWYKKPENVIGIPLDAITGLPTKDPMNSYIYYYVKGSEKVYGENEYN